MPTQITTRFTAYEFTAEELKSASVLNPLQKMFIQTQVANIAQQIINLDAGTKEAIADFEIQRSFLKGQLTSLEYLLQISEAQEINIREDEASKQYVVNPEGPNLYTSFRNQEIQE